MSAARLVVRGAKTALCMTGDGLGVIDAGAVVVGEDGRIAWVGPEGELGDWPGARVLDAGGGVLMPGLVDCHTHLVYGEGQLGRAEDFAARAEGHSYLEVASRGGGILRTVGLTRQTSESKLLQRAEQRAQAMARRGVTTIEVKSGYGLSAEAELKQLRVARALAERGPQRIIATFLGCHVVPAEYRENRAAWVEQCCDLLIPKVAEEGLAAFVDVFVEDGAYTQDEARQVAKAARDHGLRVKLHVDQLSAAYSGARLAAELEAASADHLEHASDEGLHAMAEAGVIGVLLPGASIFLGQAPADGRRLRDAGVRIALSTDHNPGTCTSQNLWLMATLGCTLNGLTVTEALRGITVNAADALDLPGVGRLEVGAAGDLLVAAVPSPDALPYLYGEVPIRAVIRAGEQIA